MDTPLTMTLKARGMRAEVVRVATLAEASKAARAWIERNGYGASDITQRMFVRDGKRRIAEVSYNGRIWSPDGAEVIEHVARMVGGGVTMDTDKRTDWQARAEVMRAEERLRLQAVCPQARGGEMGNVLRTDLALVLGDYHAMLARAEAAEAREAKLREALSAMLGQLARYGESLSTDTCQEHWDADSDEAMALARAALAQTGGAA